MVSKGDCLDSASLNLPERSGPVHTCSRVALIGPVYMFELLPTKYIFIKYASLVYSW